jgi:hypothetical protein
MAGRSFAKSLVLVLYAIAVAVSAQERKVDAAGGGAARLPSPSLSGAWEGSQSISQRGQCSAPSSQKAVVRQPLRWNASNEHHGRASLQVFPAIGNGTDRWTVYLRENDDVIVIAPKSTVCREAQRDYSVTYLGRLTERQGHYEIKVQGKDDPCPLMCTFESTIEMRKQ